MNTTSWIRDVTSVEERQIVWVGSVGLQIKDLSGAPPQGARAFVRLFFGAGQAEKSRFGSGLEYVLGTPPGPLPGLPEIQVIET